MTRVRLAMIFIALLLPVATLIPLGSLWLWQNGYLFYWVAAALSITVIIYLLERRALPESRPTLSSIRVVERAHATEAEKAALTAVQRLVDSVEPASVTSRGDLLALAGTAIETVAREFHPSDASPVWNFTVPEALLLTERVSARLRPIFIDAIPLGEQLTVGQVLRLYEWRSVAGYAEKAYDLWRLVRIINPVAAATQEARERMTRQIFSSLTDDLAKRALGIYIREVGSAAVELYSGRLRDAGPDDKTAYEDNYVGLGDRRPKSASRFTRVWGEAKKAARAAAHLYQRQPRK